MAGEEFKYMTACERNGISGNCGVECDEFISGGCPEAGGVFEGLYPTWTSPQRCSDARLRIGTWYAVQRRSDGALMDSDGGWKDPLVDIEGTIFATEDAARIKSERAGLEPVQIVELILLFNIDK